MKFLTIGETARRADVGIETVRYYERKGLIAPPARTAAGYRAFPPDAVRRIRFIKRAQDLGFSLAEIGELLALRVAADTTCADIRARTVGKIDQIDRKLADLQRMRRALARLADTCAGSGPASACPILDALEDQDADR
jgi:MerR family mercuric resistance operon transcriptional regulator